MGLVAYGAPQLDVPVRLNVNENPFPVPDSVVQAITNAVAACAGDLNRYPDRDARRLRTLLAEYLAEESAVNVEPHHIWPANGSNEVMLQLYQAYAGPGRIVMSFEPTYSMYAEYARTSNSTYVTAGRGAEFELDLDAAQTELERTKPTLVIIASPNNPTGTAARAEDIAQIATQLGSWSGLLIVDEAYAEFRRPGTPSSLELLSEHANLVVTRTLSKAFGLAGARIGYAIAADPQVIEDIQLVRLPYHLSAVSQVVACAALEHRADLRAQVAVLRTERDRLHAWLLAGGWEVLPSDANFLAFGTFPDRQAIWQALLDQGVLIRVTGPDGFLRVSIGTPQENDRFRAALQSVHAQAHSGGSHAARGHGDTTSPS